MVFINHCIITKLYEPELMSEPSCWSPDQIHEAAFIDAALAEVADTGDTEASANCDG